MGGNEVGSTETAVSVGKDVDISVGSGVSVAEGNVLVISAANGIDVDRVVGTETAVSTTSVVLGVAVLQPISEAPIKAVAPSVCNFL